MQLQNYLSIYEVISFCDIDVSFVPSVQSSLVFLSVGDGYIISAMIA